jgi:hypothetical protein
VANRIDFLDLSTVLPGAAASGGTDQRRAAPPEAGHDRRRGAHRRAVVGARRRTGHGGAQLLRSHRVHRGRGVLPGDRRTAGDRAGRWPTCAPTCSTSVAAGAGRGGRRVVPGRGAGGPRLPQPPGAARRPLRRPTRSARPGRGCTAPGPGALAARRDPGVPGPGRRPGQDPRATGSSRARWRPRCCAIPTCRRPPSWPAHARRPPGHNHSSPTWSDRPGDLRALAAARSCRTTWCPRCSSTWTAIPLTPSGKVDRRALPAPELPEVGRLRGSAFRARRSELAGIWADVLGLRQVGTRTTSSPSAADSILSMQLVSRARPAGSG